MGIHRYGRFYRQRIYNSSPFRFVNLQRKLLYSHLLCSLLLSWIVLCCFASNFTPSGLVFRHQMHFSPLNYVPRFITAVSRTNISIHLNGTSGLGKKIVYKASEGAGISRAFSSVAPRKSKLLSLQERSIYNQDHQAHTRHHHRPNTANLFEKGYLGPLIRSRNCSYQRNMCRATAMGGMAEENSSARNVAGGRDVLPTNVKPVHYDLTLEPNLETFKFQGEVTIE